MLPSLFSVVTAFTVLVSVVFLIYRLGLFSPERVSGRFAFLFGGILMFTAAVWQVVRYTTEYDDWFIEGAYPILDVAQVVIFIGGILLAVIGLALYADFWQTRKDELSLRDQQLSILSNLQTDAREPYQTMELMDLSIREIVSHLPDSSGAMFLLNRSQRQLVLTSSVGFTKQETALLERYPYGQNSITQAIEATEPVISGTFDFIDHAGKRIVSKFNSCLVLPLISGSEKIGALILVAPGSRYFGRTEIKYLSPVADWLAEMIKSSRLAKDLSSTKRDLEAVASQYQELARRLTSATDAFSRSDVLTSFCASMVGLATSQSVHLLGIKSGALHFYGGSEPLVELSENYRTALIDALDRRKPLIINQEATTDDGRSYIARSSLLYPLTLDEDQIALLFLKDGSPFRVTEQELKEIDIYGRLAMLTVKQSHVHRLDFTRRKGLDKILQLLRLDPGLTFSDDPGFFMKHLSAVLPAGSVGVMFAKQKDGSYAAVDGLRAGSELITTLRTLPGEGPVGAATAEGRVVYLSGRARVNQELQSFDEVNRDTVQKLFGEKGTPNFGAACPILMANAVVGVALVFMFDVSEDEKSEWQRLLTLATGLFSLRLSINALHAERVPAPPEIPEQQVIGEAINRLNNHLSAIVGNAGLAEARSDLSGEVRRHFKSIVDEAERASQYLKRSLGGFTPDVEAATSPPAEPDNLNDVIEAVLSRSRISDNLYMIAGHAREVRRILAGVDQVEFSSDTIRSLFEEAMNRFASLTEEEDVISVATYLKDGFVYLDISRHHRDFPAVQNVARFGHYQRSDEVLQHRPADTFLKHLGGGDCFYSFDRVAQDPSYLSFKFPVSGVPRQSEPASDRPRILAIDDQAVILDLISAMCQTTGYEVKTASTGEEGLQLALSERFDIILTDLAMPGLSGLEIAHEVRKKKRQLPIVLVTGWEVNISKERLEAAGITRVLYKPFRIEQLTDIITSLLASKSFS